MGLFNKLQNHVAKATLGITLISFANFATITYYSVMHDKTSVALVATTCIETAFALTTAIYFWQVGVNNKLLETQKYVPFEDSSQDSLYDCMSWGASEASV